MTDLVGDEELLAELRKAVDDADASVPQAESIRRFRVLSADFTEGGGHLTPSMKLGRTAVAKDFAAGIGELYRRKR